ncbi:transposase IS3/IS911 [Burkholderia pseudomallei]|nr:transposase IS3/IS911 [Burkholderia pseudomallei]CAJ5889333.1 transposase IS3/IS911 [Burkholderia pseudomallei]CAJ7122903.1 transposase IS3/IS911 [Burkholderia pseudomallei]CAJ9566453.1 transposase IS3/IS911 [Burkholderia pseudomallei]CAK0266308.1 transposase IS3/IS911 [Burkholderia pseudomallei]
MKKRFTEEQIIGILTEAEAGLDLPPSIGPMGF